MKFRFWMMGLAAFLALGIAAAGTTYYVDDNSNDGDVYTPDFTGNDANDGLTPSTPKLTINSLIASTNLLPGDVVLIDTGTYPTNVIVGSNVVGTAVNPIIFQGSTNGASGGSLFSSTIGRTFLLQGQYIYLRDLRITGNLIGLSLDGAKHCEVERIIAYSNTVNAIEFIGASESNAVRRSVVHAIGAALALNVNEPGRGNYIEHSVAIAPSSGGFVGANGRLTNMVGCIVIGKYGLGTIPDAGSYNVFYYDTALNAVTETLEELQRINTNWHHNTVADPKFANAAGFDFHLLSAAGFVSNGVWVTNPAVGYSPGIDFGARE